MAAIDAKPSIFENPNVLVADRAVVLSTASFSDTAYNPFMGFYVSGGGNVAIMDWGGNLTTFTSVTNGIPIWISGQRILTSTTTGTLILLS